MYTRKNNKQKNKTTNSYSCLVPNPQTKKGQSNMETKIFNLLSDILDLLLTLALIIMIFVNITLYEIHFLLAILMTFSIIILILWTFVNCYKPKKMIGDNNA
jgi:hypothetical protein